MTNSHRDNAAAEPVFNPLSPDFIRDPYPTYHRLRRLDPMHRSPLGLTMATRHADVAFILRDARFGKDFAGRIKRSAGEKALEEPVYQSMLHWMSEINERFARIGSQARVLPSARPYLYLESKPWVRCRAGK